MKLDYFDCCISNAQMVWFGMAIYDYTIPYIGKRSAFKMDFLNIATLTITYIITEVHSKIEFCINILSITLYFYLI